MSGKSLNLENNGEILAINAPKDHLTGPYVVVYKDTANRWALVAMEWDDKRCLGIRWFWGNKGNPTSSTHPTWLVVPGELSKAILAGLAIDHVFSTKVDAFLAGDIGGEELRKSFPQASQ